MEDAEREDRKGERRNDRSHDGDRGAIAMGRQPKGLLELAVRLPLVPKRIENLPRHLAGVEVGCWEQEDDVRDGAEQEHRSPCFELRTRRGTIYAEPVADDEGAEDGA